MSATLKMVIALIVGLVAGGAGGGFFGLSQVDEVRQQLATVTQERDAAVVRAAGLQRQFAEAPTRWGKELGRLVDTAAAATVAPAAGDKPADPAAAAPAPAVDPARVMDSARAILAARDSYRASIDGMRASLDGEMDAMAQELGNPTPDADRLKQLLQALKQNWGTKEKAIEEATRRMMADLGMAPPAPKPAAPGAPQAAAPAAAPAAPAAPAPAEKK
jgi:hypothetical protein